MRRSTITALSLFASSLALVACEDGPSQTFNASPPGAGTNWNNSQAAPAIDPAHQGYVGSIGGTNKVELCDAPTKAARWKAMVHEKIIPPTSGGGLDISGGPTWSGMTIEEAESPAKSPAKPNGGNCQSNSLGDQFGDGQLVNGWGDNNELWMLYRVSTRKAVWLNFWQGYLGTADFESPDGKDKYSIGVGQQIQKNSTPYTLDWVGAGGKNFVPQANELYRGLVHTFAPAIALEPDGVTCFDTARCVKGSFGDVAYFYIPAIGFSIWVDNQNAAQPVPSVPTRLDQDLTKNMAFSFAQPTMKMDAEGPIAEAGELKAGMGACTLKMGLTFSDFLAKCVQTTGDATKDKTELNKLLGGLSHGTERFRFDLSGIDVNFSADTLAADNILRDADVPQAADTSTYFNVDQSTLGQLNNDFAADHKTKDLHGTGAVYREYARLVRQELLAQAGITDGDTTKCVFPPGYDVDPKFDPGAFAASLPEYCTGFEGFITPSASGVVGDRTNLGLNALRVAPGGLKAGLKLGHQKVIFCDDANGDFQTDPTTKAHLKTGGYNACTGGDTFSKSFSKVLSVFAKGKIGNLPPEVQDVRFFWKQWVKAFIKYALVAQTPAKTDLSDVVLDEDNLFFDSIGAGQFEIAEYVDRRSASKTQVPTDVELTADVKNGIFDDYTFSRELYRGEEALYAAALEKQTDGYGQENSATLTNLFGSPVLAAAYPAMSSKGKSGWYCASNMDPAHCDGNTCPSSDGKTCDLNTAGKPYLSPYPGAFAGSSTAMSLGPSKVKVKKIYDTIQQAMIQVPLTENPYDPSTPSLPTLERLVPWAPKQPGIGFPISLTGTIDKFVTTAQMDLSGTTITANIDYDVIIDPTTHKPNKDNQIQFLAVETTDFLGDVFLCQDPASGDLLRARMYTPVANILSWLEGHPGTYAACGIVIRYSPFGNYADYITSLTNGVRLSVTQGGGFGRIVDVTLFVPGQ